MQAAQDDPSVKKEKKVGYSIAGSLSLFIHLGIFILIGGTVIIEQVIPKQAMTGDVQVTESVVEAPPEETPEETPQDVPQPTDQPQAAAAAESSPFDMNTVVVDAPSPSFNVPTLGAVSATPGLTGTAGAAGGTGGTAGGKKAINLFGLKTDAKKLGVILDCSGSAHPFLMAAFKEIDKNFEDAPTVLAMGCGMGTPKDVKVELYGSLRVDKEKDKPGSRTILGQLASGEAKFKELEKYLDKMKKRKDVWAIYGGDTQATGFGFEELIKQDVDTIYWFSDLQDKVDPAVMDKLTKELKKRGIKVIVHNFSGGKIPPLQDAFAKDTGGSTISKKPGT